MGLRDRETLPGRFDRRGVLSLPDAKGREAILKVHLVGKPMHADVDVAILAKQAYRFSGADLANLVNEAAILVARKEKETIGLEELEEFIGRVLAGPTRKSRAFTKKDRGIMAYHGAGHAVVAANLPDADPVHKMINVPQSGIGGYTRTLPEEDQDLWFKGQFEAMLTMMMGDQIVIFGDVTTGVYNDLQNASRIAQKMVTEYGMSAALESRSFDTGQDMVFFGKELAQGHDYSDAVAEKIDAEIEDFLVKARVKAREVLTEHRSTLSTLVNKLLAEETVEGDELCKVLIGLSTNLPAGIL